MKTKSKTYLLLGLVCCIWGLIVYKVFSGLHQEKAPPVAAHFKTTFSKSSNFAVDTFTIQNVNRDPFLGTLLKKPKVVKKAVKPVVRKPEVQWMPLVYNGSIKRDDGASQLFIISVAGEQRILKVGQTFKGVTLLKGSEKEVVLEYKASKKTVPKQ